jgi:hypothetical protein
MSPSKLGLQAPNTAGPVSVWRLDLHLFSTPNSQSRKSRNPWQESNKSSRSHKQVCVRNNKSVTWLGSMQRTVLNRHRRDTCNLSLAQLPTRSKSNPKIVLPGLQLLSRCIYIPCVINMIIVTIIYFLSLASDRQSLDFYRSPVA